MKHARSDYDRIQDPAGLIPDDEPVFLLRAQDKLAPGIVAKWASDARAAGASEEIVGAAFRHARAMQIWQNEHGMKIPDMPEVQP